MKRLLCILLLLLPLLTNAQGNKHLLKGTAATAKEGTMSYLVSITITGKTVSGYSITNFTQSSMKAAVEGSLDAAGNLFIKETSSLDGPMMANTTMYYFTARLKVNTHNGKKVYSGPFISRELDGTVKDQGTMMLVDETPPPSTLKPVTVVKPVVNTSTKPKPAPAPKPKPITKPAPKPADTTKPAPLPVIKRDTARLVKRDTVKPAPKPVVTVVAPTPPAIDTANYYPLYHWTTDSVKFDIWDGYKEDGDGVGITYNGNPLVKYLVLSNSKSYFAVPVEKGKINELRIDLYDEGTDPPNTPDITLHDGVHEIPLSISGKKGTKASLYFIKD